MASDYPGGIDAFDTIASDKKTSDAVGGRTHRAMHNDLGDAIEAVQTELGTDPSGTYSTVKARFEAIEGSTLPQVDAKGDLIVGTADNTYDNLTAGSNDTVLVADSAQAKGVKWAQVPTAGIADSAVTSAKIADGTIVNADISASAAIARSKISGLPTSSTDNTIVRFDSTAGAMQTSGVVIDDNNRLTVATGATGGYGFASGAVHLSGTGSPEGVVTAAPGSTWLQTDATTDVKGWIRWIKATGTGNTGWVAGPEADTGWRDVIASLENSWAGWVSDPDARLRRVGNIVFFEGHLNGASATSDDLLSMASGWRPASGMRVMLSGTTSSLWQFAEANGNAGKIRSSSRNAGLFVSGSWMVRPTDPWPTSLPGSAA